MITIIVKLLIKKCNCNYKKAMIIEIVVNVDHMIRMTEI